MSALLVTAAALLVPTQGAVADPPCDVYSVDKIFENGDYYATGRNCSLYDRYMTVQLMDQSYKYCQWVGGKELGRWDILKEQEPYRTWDC
ncbi:hypothetical protein ACIQMJ_11630 [Actinosynnema sp. NPDC091369]